MENEDQLNNEKDLQNDIPTEESVTGMVEPAQERETLPSDDGEDYGNLEICPNCLEPNTENLAVCKYCGMPLHQGADPDAFSAQETEEELAANRAAAVPEAPKKQKKQENGFRRVMPWLGLYLIYYAITGFIDVSRQIKAAEAEGQPVNAPLAYISQVIWLAAGVLMAWPLIKKGYRKLRHLPDEEEETNDEQPVETVSAESEANNAADESTTVQSGSSDEATPVTEETGKEEPSAEVSEDEPADARSDTEEAAEENAYIRNRLVNEDGTGEENENANWL